MRWLLRLYPRAWRERYEAEMLALLEEHHVTPATVLDLLLGALDANLCYSGVTEGAAKMAARMRSGVVTTFCAFMLFGVGWGLLQRLTDPLPIFQGVNKLHPELGILFDALLVLGCIGFLAFLAGGLPLFILAARRAFKGRVRKVLHPMWAAITSLAVFVAATGLLAVIHPAHDVVAWLIGYLALTVLCLITGTVAVALVIARTDFQLSEIQWLVLPEIAILFCMGAAVVVSILLCVAVTVHAPQLFQTQDVNTPMFMTGLTCMALAVIFAGMALRRANFNHRQMPDVN